MCGSWVTCPSALRAMLGLLHSKILFLGMHVMRVSEPGAFDPTHSFIPLFDINPLRGGVLMYSHGVPVPVRTSA